MTQRRALTTADGLELVAEVAPGEGAVRAGVLLCHPHPQFGGTMHSLLVAELFRELPPAGVTCLRFDFRGVGGSAGTWDEGRGELRDVAAAVSTLATLVDGSTPVLLAGWSFGADMALATIDPRVTGWLAIAPPLRFAPSFDAVGSDPRPKHLVLGAHDELQSPDAVRAATEHWSATTIEVVAGASHFFVGRIDRVVAAARAMVDRVTAPRGGDGRVDVSPW